MGAARSQMGGGALGGKMVCVGHGGWDTRQEWGSSQGVGLQTSDEIPESGGVPVIRC